MAKHTLYYELSETLAEPGCVICHIGQKAVARYLESLVYENANDYHFRAEVVPARGFCNPHAWQLRDCRGAGLDVAILSNDVLTEWLKSLQAFVPAPAPAEPLERLRSALGMATGVSEARALVETLAPQRACPVCRTRDTAEKAYIQELLTHLDDAIIATGYVQAGGLCLPHFRKALQNGIASAQAERLVQLQTEALTLLLHTLQEFIRKHDYRFEAEMTAVEGKSWLQALALISGERGAR